MDGFTYLMVARSAISIAIDIGYPGITSLGNKGIPLRRTTLSQSDEDMYPGYMTEVTQQAHVGVGIGPHYNEMVVEYPLQIESYLDKIKSCN
jgi:hypothetical protein